MISVCHKLELVMNLNTVFDLISAPFLINPLFFALKFEKSLVHAQDSLPDHALPIT